MLLTEQSRWYRKQRDLVKGTRKKSSTSAPLPIVRSILLETAMAPVTNGRVLFNEIPQGYPEPGRTTVYDTSETIDLDAAPLNGGVLIKILVLSSDPYIRGRMRDASIKSYSPAYELGKPLLNFGVGVVLRSEEPSIKPGTHLYGMLPFQHYIIKPATEAKQLRVLENKEGLPWSVYVGVCGMPGKTAWMGWKEYAAAKAGTTVFITAGSGPVGATVIQLAKADGLRVIAAAGSEKKVAYCKEIGADVAFNYKTDPVKRVLKKEGPIDVYWDNVGGESLEAALDAANKEARFIECGMISSYNQAPYHIQNLAHIFAKQLTIHGFIVYNHYPKYDDAFYADMPPRVAKGEIKYLEDISEGLESAGKAILDVQLGKNVGKKVIKVADE